MTNQTLNWNLARFGVELKNPRWWRETVIIAIAYATVSWVVIKTMPSDPVPLASPVWPGSGIVVGLLLAWGRSRWLGVFFGIFCINLINSGLSALLPALGASIGSTIGTLVIVSLTLRFTGTNYPFEQVRHVVTFLLCSIFSGTIFQTMTGTISYALLSPNAGNAVLKFSWPWWIGDSVGILLFASLILVWLKRESEPKIKSWLHWEIVTAFVSLIIVAVLAFYQGHSVEYLLLPPLLWSAFRFGARLTTFLVMLVSVTASLATAYKFGVFYKAILAGDSLLLLQLFMGVIAITTMLVLAIVSENDQANLRLKRANIDLEQRVIERTHELQKSEANARELATKAESANHAKSAFIANMSHELRSPLNAVIGFSQLMMRTPKLPTEQYENASIINRSGDYLLTLINNILDLSKLEAGKSYLNVNNFDLYHLLDDIEDMLQMQATNAGISLSFAREHNVPRYICTDETKLRQVLINLLNNALKFTEVGTVFLSLTNISTDVSRADNNCILHFSVRDTGVGIAPEEIPNLFVSFSQAQAGREKQEGTGLGLAISLKFVQLMGGDISVTSELGKGTTFQVQIQAQLGKELIDERTAQKRTLAIAADQPIYKILVVDDNSYNRQLLIKILRPLGFEVKEASNGKEAIDIWDKWEPHLIWMDMRMPVMDGYEATRYIKSTTKGNATAVIALTASSIEEEGTMVLSAGCDDFLRKPFKEQVIFDTLAKHLGVKYIYEQTPAHEHEIDIFQETAISSENLKIMSDQWIIRLYKSALEADKSLVMQVIEEIPDQQTFLVRSLIKLARNFQFEKLIDLAEPLLLKTY